MDFLNYLLGMADLAFRTGVITFVILMISYSFFFLEEKFNDKSF